MFWMKEQTEPKLWIYPKSNRNVNGAKNKTSFVQLRDDTFNLKLLHNRLTHDQTSLFALKGFIFYQKGNMNLPKFVENDQLEISFQYI